MNGADTIIASLKLIGCQFELAFVAQNESFETQELFNDDAEYEVENPLHVTPYDP